jgi:ABC-type bacteriocin/lantibiotic exporter with double-glycine peptidase domain
MAKPLSVPFHPQIENGYCLAACVQMVMAFYGEAFSQRYWARKLDIRPGLGAPAPNIKNLASDKVQVEYGEGTQHQFEQWLNLQVPVIVFIQAGDLPHWHREFFQHAVVVTGIMENDVFIMDPALNDGPSVVSQEAFLLAWSGMDYLYAVLKFSRA